MSLGEYDELINTHTNLNNNNAILLGGATKKGQIIIEVQELRHTALQIVISLMSGCIRQKMNIYVLIY